MSPTSSNTAPFAADLLIGTAVRAPAMIKMTTMIITRQAGRRRTS